MTQNQCDRSDILIYYKLLLNIAYLKSSGTADLSPENSYDPQLACGLRPSHTHSRLASDNLLHSCDHSAGKETEFQHQ